ncbi:TlpA family protein disulfide reductase [Sphingobacterium sp. SG20118]|uniref:TlpA family protein disulfide reductase n=1 Tax=Sphingobacterium sp. SG20118 TaxID=3367156 RepID=UPI0037DFC6AD
MFNLISVFSCLALLLCFSNNLSAQSKDEFLLKAIIDTVPNATYFIRYSDGEKMMRDTVTLDSNSRLLYKGTLSEPTIFTLSVPTYNSKFAGDSDVYAFWVQPGRTILVNGNKGWLVKGKYGLVTKTDCFTIKNSDLDSIENSYKKKWHAAIDFHKQGKELTDDESLAIFDSVRNNFILDEPKNYYGLYLINNEMKSNNFDSDQIKKWISSYPESLKSTHLGKEIYAKISINEMTSIGRVLPDFEQPDTASNLIKLSDLRGKYVLVDFWASWCGPCRVENPHLIKAYERFKSKGFDIIGVSFDKEKKSWLKAIHDDGLTWTQVSDLKGINNEVAKLFSITAIPEKLLARPKWCYYSKRIKRRRIDS